MSNKQASESSERKIVMADPTALGVFGLAMVTLVAGSQKIGWTTGVSSVIPWALLLGSAAQLWASNIDFKRNNYFGATVLGAYGLFWAAVAMHWLFAAGIVDIPDAAKIDNRHLAFACLGYTVFSFFIMIASFETNKVFAAILVLINILLASLSLSLFGIAEGTFKMVAAVSELAISVLGFYAAGALFLNSFFGRVVMPMGAPFGFIKKAR